MNNRKKGWREIGWLLAPVLALGCWGAWMQIRPLRKNEPFKLTIDEIKVSTPVKGRMTTNETNVRPVEVDVFVGHQGAKPAWWGKGMNPANFRVHFTAVGKKDLHNENVGGSGGVSWDKSRGQYFIHHSGRIPKTPNFLNHATCHVSIELSSQTPPYPKVAKAHADIPMDSLK